jgi:hypothetical protein
MRDETLQERDGTASGDAGLRQDATDRPSTSGESDKIVVPDGRIPSPLEEVLLDLGKQMFKDSIAQSVEFNKTMLGLTATFATLMASSFGILAFGMKDKQLDTFQRVFLVVPVVVMLSASVCFALGYYPRDVEVRLRVLNTIEAARTTLLRQRATWARRGIALFILAIVALLGGIVLLNIS